MRRLHPEMADYIQRKKLKRGEKYPPLPDISMVLVPLIRMIWRKHYKDKKYPEGRWKRSPEDGYSAEEIAAYYLVRYLGVPAKDLRIKPRRRKKKPSTKSPI